MTTELLHVTNETFQEEVLEAKLPVLVDFYADWCGPCKMVAPVVEEIAAESADSLKVVKLNIDSAEEIAARYSVMSIPTLILFRNGAPAAQTVGFKSKDAILRDLGL